MSPEERADKLLRGMPAAKWEQPGDGYRFAAIHAKNVEALAEAIRAAEAEAREQGRLEERARCAKIAGGLEDDHGRELFKMVLAQHVEAGIKIMGAIMHPSE